MSSDLPSSAIIALREQLGEQRFVDFIHWLAARNGEPLAPWQEDSLDQLEAAQGPILPRQPDQLLALLQPCRPVPLQLPRLPAEAVPAWICIDKLLGFCPVQADGSVQDPEARFYFRAKHESWAVSLSMDPELDPVDVYSTDEDGYYYEEAFDDPGTAGWMDLDTARFFLVRELTRWRVELRTR